MLPAFRTEFNALAQETSAAVAMRGYTFSLPFYRTHHYLETRDFARVSGIVALLTARDGDCFHAMDIAVLPIRLVRREPRSWIITHLIACAMINIASDTIYTIAEECKDPSALRYGLSLMDGVSDIAHPKYDNLWKYADWATTLAAMKATGYPVDLSPQPLAGYADQAWEVYAPKFNNWVVDNLPGTDPRVETARKNLDSWKERINKADTVEKKLMTRAFAYRALVEIALGYKAVSFYEASTNNWLDVPYRARITTINFDLARLRIAQRIAELEAASQSADTSGTLAAADTASTTLILGPDVIADIMRPVPDDPYPMVAPASPLQFSTSRNRFYSLGPDDDDDGMAIKYDPSNGTISDGDAFLNPKFE